MHQVAGALAGTTDFHEALDRAASGTDIGLGSLRISQYCPDNVVEVMGNAAGECADGFHTARMLQILLQALPVALQYFAVECVGNSIECHAQHAELTPALWRLAAHCIKSQHRVDALLAQCGYAQPAVDDGLLQRCRDFGCGGLAYVIDLDGAILQAIGSGGDQRSRYRPAGLEADAFAAPFVDFRWCASDHEVRPVGIVPMRELREGMLDVSGGLMRT